MWKKTLKIKVCPGSTHTVLIPIVLLHGCKFKYIIKEKRSVLDILYNKSPRVSTKQQYILLSVTMCSTLVTNVSAPAGHFSTNWSNSGEFIPIARTWVQQRKSIICRRYQLTSGQHSHRTGLRHIDVMGRIYGGCYSKQCRKINDPK